MANKIYAGPVSETLPQVKEAPAGQEGILPGSIVVLDGGEFVAHGTAGARGRYYVAQENYLAMRGVDEAYPEGDVTIGMIPLDEQFFRVRLAASQTITEDTALASDGDGLLVAAGEGDEILFYAEEDVTTGAEETALCLARVANGVVPTT